MLKKAEIEKMIAERTAGTWRGIKFATVDIESAVYRKEVRELDCEVFGWLRNGTKDAAAWEGLSEDERLVLEWERAHEGAFKKGLLVDKHRKGGASVDLICRAEADGKAFEAERIWIEQLIKARHPFKNCVCKQLKNLVREQRYQQRRVGESEEELASMGVMSVEEVRHNRKYATVEERKAAAKAYQEAYRLARKNGTWRPKREIGKRRVIEMLDERSPQQAASVQQQGAGAEARQSEIGDWDEIVMPYLGSHDGEGARKQGKGRKLTPEEMREYAPSDSEREAAAKRAAKSEWQRRYRELKRLAAGKPKRGRRKYATPEEAKEAAREYHRAYGKKYRALKKSGAWQPKAAKRDEGLGIGDQVPVEPEKKGGRRSQFATEEERRAAKNEYNRKYHLLRKTGLWVRKNRVFSERVAKSAGVLTEKERIAQAMSFPAKRLFGSEAEWKIAVEAKCKRAPMTKKEREERRQRIKEQYGFDIWTPVKKLTPEELEGRKRWLRDEEAEYRNRNREHITIYNREYRKRKRAEALAIKQKTWTAEEWAAWEKKQAARGRGTPEHFVKEVVKVLAESGKISEDEVMDHLLEHGGVDFLMSGAEAIGKDRAKRPSMVKAAAMAVALYIDPEGAVMFPK